MYSRPGSTWSLVEVKSLSLNVKGLGFDRFDWCLGRDNGVSRELGTGAEGE